MQANREIVYYTLVSSAEMWEIANLADRLDKESFAAIGMDETRKDHLWIPENNKCFLEFIAKQSDLQKLNRILGEQLKLYARKHREGYEKNKGDHYKVYNAYKDWLKHTIFICKNEYNKNKNEIFAEAVNWCEEYQRDWLETLNPYSPKEEARIKHELTWDLKIPLWQRLTEEGDEMPEVKADAKSNNKGKDKKPKPQTLLQAWNKEKGKTHYNKVIAYLKDRDNSLLEIPFVNEDENGNLKWLPNDQYLGAFLKRCQALGFVDNTITAKEWVQIFNQTFNLNIALNSAKPFLPGKTFHNKFTEPFEKLSLL